MFEKLICCKQDDTVVKGTKTADNQTHFADLVILSYREALELLL